MTLLRVFASSRNLFRNNGTTRDIPWRHIIKKKDNLLQKIKQELIINKNKLIENKPIKLNNISIGFGIATSFYLKLHLKKANCQSLNDHDLSIIHDHNKKLNDFQWRKLIQYILPNICHLLIAITSAFIVAVLNIWIPQCVSHIVNVITKVRQDGKASDGDFMTSIFQQLALPAFKLARMYVIQALFTFTYVYTLSCVGERVAMKLRQDLFKSILHQDIEFFDKNRSGEIISRLTSDIQEFKSSFKTLISQGLRSCTQLVGCVVSMIIISPQLTGLMVLCMPTVVFIGSIVGRSLRKLSAEAQEQIGKSTAVCEEAIQNIRTVRAFAAENNEIEKYSEEIEKSAMLYEKLGLGIGFFQAGTNLFLNSILLSTLYFGGHLLSSGQVSFGDLMAFLMATQTIQRSLTSMSLLFGTYIKGASAGARVFDYLEMNPSPMMIYGEPVVNKSLSSNISFDNVNFSYPTRPDYSVLSNFNLNIPAGKTVAIVGSSGNGKSTVAALLERMYDVTSGTIKIDGVDIKTINSSDLRGKLMGYIDQEPILFSTSIMENIRYGCLDATDEEVIEVAKNANAHEFITKFPDGYDTLVGERGAQLSGGQKQRVAIARALLKKPSILILDEATSALDYESERIVQTALDNATKGRTVLVIAHRLSTIKSADIIVVLQRGSIAEMGTHDELIKKRGAYFNLVSREENDKKNEQ